ncbi:MAG: folate-binding protein YgfZ [Alphaproteobacteria bacterium]|nr:folate-binding protein YgfZ [Alphaproteobacteria bacterium]
MAEKSFVVLPERGLLTVGGPDRRGFLQGLVSNDIEKVSAAHAIHAALLTAQGKYLHDFFIAEFPGGFLLDGEAARLPDLQRRLSLYKLRAKVTVAPAEGGFAVVAAFGPGALEALSLPQEPGAAAPFAGGLVFVDPRLAALGARLILPREGASAALRRAGFAEAAFAAYDRTRLELGVPDGSRDLVIEKSILLESGFDELNGVDWQKGCYVGQELTARTKYRGLVKKRLMPVRLAGPAPRPGTPIRRGAEEVGEIRSGQDGIALALLRLEAVHQPASGELVADDGTRLTPLKPGWAAF